eukprot:jgi/Ulvmu1/406/UM001_0413.1
MDGVHKIYAPSANEFLDAELFGARFPMAKAQLSAGEWTLGREPVEKSKNPKLAAYQLVDDVGATFKGTPLSGGQGDGQAQHFALITKGSKTYAVPVEWFYVFKKHRKEVKTEEELAEDAKAKQQREDKVSRAFNKKFQIDDTPNDDVNGRKVKAVSQFDSIEKAITKRKPEVKKEFAESFEPEIDELFALDEEQAEGWDYDEDIANDDLEQEVNKEVVEERKEEEEAELERQHEESEKELKKKGMVVQQEEKEDLQIDLDDEEAGGGAVPLHEAQRQQQLEAEKEGFKHMARLRKRVKHRQANESVLLNLEQSDDSDDSESDEDSDADPNGTQTQPAVKAEGENKRPRPDDMQGPFVAVKRANVSLLSAASDRDSSMAHAAASAPSTVGEAEIQVGDLTPETYAQIAAAARDAWPKDPLDQPLRQCRMRDVIDVLKSAYARIVGRMTKTMVKEMFQAATKGSPGKPPFLESSGKVDGKTVFNIV